MTIDDVIAAGAGLGDLTDAQKNGARIIAAKAYELGLAGDNRILAYILATAYHETAGTMQPIHERGSDEYLAARYDVKGKDPVRARRMGNTTPGDGVRYCGRGYVQLTWKANYARAGRELGVDLVAAPARAMEPDIAAQILVRGMIGGWFTGRRLDAYIGGTKADYVGARAVVNGSDKAGLIAVIARRVEAALAASRDTEMPTHRTTARLNLRGRPLDGDIIETLAAGAEVAVLETWHKVSVSGRIGWVSGRFLDAIEAPSRGG